MYTHYKPLRNFLATKQLFPALETIWAHANRFGFDASAQQRALDDSGGNAFLWELELLAREVVLNGSLLTDAKQLSKSDLGAAINHVRHITEAISRAHIHCTDDAIVAVLPLLHQQQPWMDQMFVRLYRYARVMRHPPLADILEQHLNISLPDLFKLGLAVAGGLQNAPGVIRSNYLQTPGIAPGASEAFFALVTTEVGDLRARTRSLQTYDRGWAYTYNPLRGSPLVCRSTAPENLFWPIPQLMLWRITEGLFYDLRDHKHFAAAFGDAFEIYIGSVLRAALPAATFNIQGETPYKVGHNEKHGADWRISDRTGHVFVECKAKRLTLPAKAHGEGEEMDRDVQHMVASIVQNYKNINDGFAGNVPGFSVGNLPVYSVVTTLEDWRLDLPHLTTRIDALVRQALAYKNIPVDLVDRCPYTVLSAFQFENRWQDVARAGIAASFTTSAPGPRGPYRHLFPQTLGELMPDIAESAGLTKFS